MHQAYVIHRNLKRKAKGFTCQEATEAGITCQQFDALKLPWDSRRKTKYAENVAYLKSLAKPEIKQAKPKKAKPAKK
jgi:ribosomal protein L13E